MDPIARRFMWDIISRMTTTDRECSVILTTHSMEEAESLCNNIGIMVRRTKGVVFFGNLRSEIGVEFLPSCVWKRATA